MTPQKFSGPGAVYGVITLDGQQYVERYQLFVQDHVITAPFQVLTNLRLTMPGVANFLLKGLVRDFTNAQGLPDSINNDFRFRLVGSEGTTWFLTGGLGVFDDRAIDANCFGSGQFPFPLIPPIPVHGTGSLIYEIEDIGFYATSHPEFYPITIHLGFVGNYLFPAEDAPTKGPLAFPGVTHGIIRTR